MRIKSSARQQHSASEKARILAAWQRCELTDKAFAAQQGVGLSTLYSWQRRQRARAAAGQAQWVEVPNLLAKETPPAPYRLHLPGGRMLEVTRNFEPSEVRLLAQLLQSL
jgi:hypothetical protein